MSPPVPRYPAAPPWRTLGALAALVLLAHALVLRLPPGRFGALEESGGAAPVFSTRSIPLAPAAEMPVARQVAPAPTPPAAKPEPRPVKKRLFRPKATIVQTPRAQSAIDSVASNPLSSEAPPTVDAALAPAAEAAPPAAAAPAETARIAEPAPPQASPPASEAAAPAAAPAQTPVTAITLPASARLDYRLSGSAKGLTYHAKGQLVWRNSEGSYDASLTVSAFFIGSRTMSSTGQVGADGLAPSRFSDKSRSEVAAHLDSAKGQIIFSANTPVLPWVKGAQDRVSVVLQLGGMLAGDPARFPAGSTISVYTVGPRDAESWTFRVDGEEALTLPFGELATLKLSRQPRREFDQTIEVWYAPSLGFLPVRTKITQANGDYVDQALSAIDRL